MKQSIFHVYRDLRQQKNNEDYFSVAPLPFSSKHKIGVSKDKNPIFFVECSSSEFAMDIKLELISILFNRECQLVQKQKDGDKTICSIYSIIELKSDSVDVQQYFVDVVALILQTLPKEITFPYLKAEIKKIVDLFSRFNKPPLKQIQGLWAELLIVEQAENPDYLISSWHNSSNDKFDFNDGIDKIEVKSTSQSKRVHNFSINQLNPNKNSNLLIASVIVVNTGVGENIFDLIDSICIRVKNPELQFRLKEIVGQVIGQDFEKISSLYYDYQQAVDTLSFYHFRDIPTIAASSIPSEIDNIHFTCDISNIKPLSKKTIDTLESQLFKSI